MILWGILVMILCLYYREAEHGPGKVLLYVVIGLMNEKRAAGLFFRSL